MLIPNTTDIELGVIPKNEIKHFQFTVRNDSDHDIPIILDVSCGCTKPVSEKNPVPANSTVVINATFDTTGKSGHVTKFMYIYYMKDNEKLKLTVKFSANIV